MSKNKKAGKNPNPNRPRSKNNPDGKRNDPQIMGPIQQESPVRGPTLHRVDVEGGRHGAREILGIPQGKRD